MAEETPLPEGAEAEVEAGLIDPENIHDEPVDPAPADENDPADIEASTPGAMVFLRTEGGPVYEFDLPLSESMEGQLRLGIVTQVADLDGTAIEFRPRSVVEVAADGTAVAADAADAGQLGQLPGLPQERPAKSAGKADWVGWAVRNGMPLDDAQALTKDDLIDQFGLVTVAP